MKEKPILFSGEMVRAILEGRKSQTRRVVKVRGVSDDVAMWLHYMARAVDMECPYGKPGDRLWVRETWRTEELESGLDGVRYAADDFFLPIENTMAASEAWGDAHFNKHGKSYGMAWRPSIYMPRWASRIMLEVVKVRVERVQEITRDDAKAEGVSKIWAWNAERNAKHPEHFRRGVFNPYVANYSVLWDEINAKRGFGWDVNPWVWVVEFKQVNGGENAK
jgi:hypothetical protein